MNPNTQTQVPQICVEIREHLDNTLRADAYLALKWRDFIGYLGYDEDDVETCLPYLGVELRDNIVFLWAGEEYYRRLVEIVTDLARQKGTIVADPYETS